MCNFKLSVGNVCVIGIGLEQLNAEMSNWSQILVVAYEFEYIILIRD